MKKFKIKVFIIISSIFSIFILSVLVVLNYRTYNIQKNRIEDILNRPIMERRFIKETEINDIVIRQEATTRNIFLDSTVYTIILDEKGNYKELINNTENDEIDEEKIKEVANNIISKHKKKKSTGNLYFSKYSYSFTNFNTLIIIDNSEVNNDLKITLLSSIIIFIALEIIVFIITYYLTRWVTEPVEEAFNKQKQFVEDASHELKTPLAVIMASTDAYKNDKDEKWINNIRNESERMNKLVKDLLDLAKLENNKEILKQNENISNIVESSVLTFESLFYEKNIKLDYNIKEDIMFNCNSDEIKELMGILIDNAIKHSENKGKVIINLNTEGKEIILEVKNKGLPIKEEDKERIFERFYKVDSSRNRNSNNYGLGLAIAKNIVINHNGKITASSKDGYTTFKVVMNQK